MKSSTSGVYFEIELGRGFVEARTKGKTLPLRRVVVVPL